MNLKEDLKAYVDGELNADQVKELERAAASSEEIRDEIAVLRSLKEDCVSLSATPEPTGKAALLHRLKGARPARKPNFMWAYAGATAALLIGIAIIEPVFSQVRIAGSSPSMEVARTATPNVEAPAASAGKSTIPSNVRTQAPVASSHSRTKPVSDAVKTRSPSPANAIWATPPLCPG